MNDASSIRVFDLMKALAFVGDLSMGQPTDHSLRTAWLADRIAAAAGCGADERETAREAALLRWSGCTANASGFAELIGDDISGREAMLAQRPGWSAPLESRGEMGVTIAPLAQVHCEVSGEVARLLTLGAATEASLRQIFENYDGSGWPGDSSGSRVPAPVFVVALAGDLEIFSRVYGLDRALELIAGKAGVRYPAGLADGVRAGARSWLRALEDQHTDDMDAALGTARMQAQAPAELIADVIDLKLPWLTGHSREVARLAAAGCHALGLDATRAYRAGLLHGIGRAAIPNHVWEVPGALSPAAWEKARLAPYWTSRAGRQIGALAAEAELASHAYERLDGSGYFRGIAGPALSREAQVLTIAVAWTALRAPRPWRPAMEPAQAAAQLGEEARRGRFDPALVEQVAATAAGKPPPREKSGVVALSTRETEVLRAVSRGASNKEAARTLALSPSTVRTHMENVFRKLCCSTRAAATLKASALGLL